MEITRELPQPSLTAAARVVFDGYTLARSPAGISTASFAMSEIGTHYLNIGHPDTAAEALREHSKHTHHLIRLRVAKHPSSPHDVLTELAGDEHPEIRLAVSYHPHVAPDVLERLVNDASPDVRYGLAENPHLPVHLLRRLMEDENAYVSHRARKTFERLSCDSDRPD